MKSLQSTMWLGTLVYIHFIILAFVPQQICLLHATHMFNALILLSTYWPHINVHTSSKKPAYCIFQLTCYFHICATKNMPFKCQLLQAKILDTYVNIYTLYEINAISNATRSTGIHTFHITGKCTWINMSATLYIYVPLHLYCSLHRDPTLLHTSIKINKLPPLFIYHKLKNMCQQQISPWNATWKPYAKITWCTSMGQVCQYMCHTWTHWQ